jgi:hypothetical protein
VFIEQPWRALDARGALRGHLLAHAAVTTYAVTMALKAKTVEETAQWLETLAQGVRAGDISLSGLSMN